MLTLKEAARLIPGRGGCSLSVKAVRRRITQGVGGIRLRAINNGSDWFTTAAWIDEFLTAATGEPTRINAGEGHRRAMETLTLRYGFQHEQNEVRNQGVQRGSRNPRPVQVVLSKRSPARRGR